MTREIHCVMPLRLDSAYWNSLMHFSLFAVFTVSLLAFSTESHSQVPDQPDVITVTGTIIPDSNGTDRIPKFTLSGPDIDRIAASSVTDLLRIIPGLHITQQGGSGGLTFISMRGGDPNFTIVLIDGVKVNDPTNSRGGAFDLSALDPASIEKIEFFYGSYSPVIGSDALSGLISITTRRAGDDLQASVSGEIGSHDSWAGSGHISGPLGDFAEAALSVSIRDGGDAVERDSLRRKQVNARVRSAQTSAVQWSLSLLFAEGSATAFPEDSGGDRLAVLRTPEDRDFEQINMGGNVYWQASSRWALRLASSWARHEDKTGNPGIAPGIFQAVPAIFSDSNFERFDLSLTNIVTITDELQFGFGGTYASEDGKTDSIIDFGFPVPAPFTLERDIWSGFGEMTWNASDDLDITGGIRFDDAGTINATTTRLAVNYRLPDSGTAFSFQFGEGFKLPSFFALGQPFVGNMNLRPERSRNFDFTVKQTLFEEKVLITASLFRNRFNDLVDFDPQIFRLVNRSQVRAKGGEFQINIQPSEKVTLFGQISFTHTSTSEAGVNLRRRPKWRGGGHIAYSPTEHLRLSFRGLLVGRFNDSSIPTGNIVMPGYERFDVSAEWSPLKNIVIRAAITNLFNAGFEETVGFSNPGRQARLIFTARL